MALQIDRCWNWTFAVLCLLIFPTLRASPVSHPSATRDWTTCSRHALDESVLLRQWRGACSLVDDWSHWSQQPFCPDPVNDNNSGQADCVFTFASFRGNQGLSLVTTPKLAASVVEHLDDSHLSPSIKHQLSGFDQNEQDGSAAYEIRDLPGRGKGLVTKHRVARHDTVMVGFPVLIVRLDFVNGERYSQRQKRAMMETGVRQLPAEQQRAIAALARNTGGERILDALRTNGFGIDIEGVQHLALFIDGSRVNHNCRPNAFWRYINTDMAMEVIALRDIQAGEEVAHSCKSYIFQYGENASTYHTPLDAPLGYTYEERRTVLQVWGFRCRCALCSAPPAERGLSDKRREYLLDIHKTLGQASELTNQRVNELVDEALTIIGEEDLQPQLVEYYQQFAKAYLMRKNFPKAREFVAKADKMWRFYGGEDHENLDGMRALWRALEEAETEAEED